LGYAVADESDLEADHWQSVPLTG